MNDASPRHDPVAGLSAIPADLPRAAGQITWLGNGLNDGFRGWLLDPDAGPFEEVHVLADGRDVGAARRSPAPALGRHMPWVRDVREAGFVFKPESPTEPAGRIDLIGFRGGAAAGRFSTLPTSDADRLVPMPPMEVAVPSNALAQRGGAASAEEELRWEQGFLRGGKTAAAGLLNQIEAQRGSAEGLRLLDWGCGCGRVVRHLLDQRFESVSGCDVDERALAWCRENIPDADFSRSGIEPPLPFEESSFDVIVGVSVFTHLDPTRQASWLAELRRVIAPGGLVLVTTQGDFAYRRGALRGARLLHRTPALARMLTGRLSRKLEREGFIDRGATRALDGTAPSGYYRSVAQSADYIRRAWSSHFEIVDVIDRGLDGHQDLVVME